MAAPQKKYVCTFCARAFTRSEHKQRHERSHTNEKPFHCLYCTSAFVRRDLLQRHCRTVHHIHKVPRKMLQEKESATNPQKILPKPEFAASKKNRTSSVDFDPQGLPDQGVLLNRDGSASECSVESTSSARSSASSAASHIFDSPVLPGAPVVTDMKYSLSMGDASLIASARVLLQLAPHKTESCDLGPLLTYLPRTPIPSAASLNDTCSPNVLPRARNSIGMLPTSVLSRPSIARPDFENEADKTEKLLHAARTMEHLCDISGRGVPIADMFLLGYATIDNEPVMLRSQYSKGDSTYLAAYFQGAPFSDFDVGVAYTISAIGAIGLSEDSEENHAVAKDLINKAWTFLIEYLIPRHTLIENQLEILNNLYLLAHTYLNHFNSDLMIGYLEETTHAIVERVNTSQERGAKEMLKSHMDVLWNIYILVSKYKSHNSPPKFYSWMLSQTIDGYFPLSHYMLTFPKDSVPLDNVFFSEIIACTFSNEVNGFSTNNTLTIFSSRLELRTALDLAIKSLVNFSSHSQSIDIFNLHKNMLLLECPEPVKFDLKQNLCKISMPYEWQILSLSMSEANVDRKLQTFILENSHSSFDTFGKAFLDYLSTDLKSASSEAKLNSLSTLGYSLTLNGKLLQVRSFAAAFKQTKIKSIESKTLNVLVLEWYLSVIKSFISLLTTLSNGDLDRIITESRALQGLIHVSGSQKLVENMKASEIILQLYKKLTTVCESWLNINKGEYKEFRSNLARFLNDLFLLASNNNDFSLENAYLSNGSICVQDRSNFKERRSMSMSLPMTSSHSDHHALSCNYVLIKPKDLLPSVQLPAIDKPSAAILPPLVAVNGLQLPPTRQHRLSYLELPSLSYLTVKGPPFVLPPLQHTIHSELSDRPVMR